MRWLVAILVGCGGKDGDTSSGDTDTDADTDADTDTDTFEPGDATWTMLVDGVEWTTADGNWFSSASSGHVQAQLNIGTQVSENVNVEFGEDVGTSGSHAWTRFRFERLGNSSTEWQFDVAEGELVVDAATDDHLWAHADGPIALTGYGVTAETETRAITELQISSWPHF